MAAKATPESPLSQSQNERAAKVAWLKTMYTELSYDEIIYILEGPDTPFDGSVAGTVHAKPFDYVESGDGKAKPVWRVPKNGV